MSQSRKHYDEAFKLRITLVAIREQKALTQIARRYDLYPVLVTKRKKQALDQYGHTFFDHRKKESKAKKEVDNQEELLKQIGRLTVEDEWLKKVS